MAAIAVIPEPLNNPPRIRIHITGVTGTVVTITRRNGDGTGYSVRTANPATLASGAWQGYDYESPFAQNGVYTARSDGGTVLTQEVAAQREFGVQTPWLIHPGIPSLSQPVELAHVPVPVSDVNMGVFTIMGRVEPLTRTDGVRHAPTFDLTLNTRSWDEQDALSELLSDGSPLLLQITYPRRERGDYYWVAVGQVTPTPLVDNFDNPYVVWTLACTVTSAPAGLLVAQWSCSGVLATYATCDDVLDAYTTCTNLLINNPRAA